MDAGFGKAGCFVSAHGAGGQGFGPDNADAGQYLASSIVQAGGGGFDAGSGIAGSL